MGPLDVFDTSDNGSWQWMQNATMVVAPEQVGRMLTLNLHTREPGTQLDRIVLHKTSSLDGAQLDGLFDAPSGVVARDRLELFREDFETDGAGVRYTVSGPNAGSKWLRTNGTALAQLGAPAGDGGSWYFGGKGLGAEHALVFDTAVDADAYQDLQLSLDMANGDEGFELGEYLKVEVRHGDGAWNELVSYRPAADAQKLAEGGLIPANDQGQPSSDDMRRFGSYLIPAGGGGLSLRITAFCDSDAEQLAVDNLRIHGTPRPDDFDTWSAANIADPSLRGFADDADGDGIPNGLEAFLGTNPIVASPGIGGLSASGSGILSFSHPYNTTVPGWISATYQWSPNLRDWYASGQGPSGQPKVTVEALRSSGISSVTATASEAMNQYFIRLRVSGN